MRILLTNDDGLRAPGIEAMHDAMVDAYGRHGGVLSGQIEQLAVVAPLTVQSATSHGVTFHIPLMVRPDRFRTDAGVWIDGTAVEGRPADCVKLALSNLWGEKFGAGSRPDLVISGMNDGANCGINVIYSGTVAAALEAAFLGVPSIAVSLHRGAGRSDFALAAAHARTVLDKVLAGGPLGAHTCLSVNIPRMEAGKECEKPGELPIRVCPMNTHGLNDQYERRTSPSGEAYYWASGHGLDFRSTDEGSDVQLLMRRSITVTPLMYDLTRHGAMEEWVGRLEG